MLYLADPAPIQTAQPYNDSALKAAVDELKANETIDDQTAAALETLVKAKDAAHDNAITDLKLNDATTDAALKILSNKIDAIKVPDLSGYALKSEIPSSVVQKAEIDPIYDLLPTPTPMQVLSGTGATATPATTGSLLVNQGKTHTTARTTTPPLIAWESTMTISPVVGECRVRWGILSVRQGTIEIQLGTASAIQASNTGLGWDCADPTVTIKIDGNYTCFDKLIPAQQSPLNVRFQFPTGPSVVQLPSLYSTATPFSMIPANPTGLKLRAMPGGEELPYRPGEFAKLTDIPSPYDPSPLITRVTALESAPETAFTRVADTKWFDTFAGTNQSYKRKASRTSTTSISFEIFQSGGSIRQFSLTDFTGFAYSGFGNGAGDPNGVTKAIPGPENVLIIWDGTGETLSIIVTNVGGITNYQIRKVRVNGQPLDWLSIYEPPIPAVVKDKLSYIVNGGAQDQAVPVNGTVLLDTVNKLINPDNLTDLAFVANGRVVFPIDGRVSVTGTFYRTTATGVVEPVLFVYKGSGNTTKMQFNQTGIMANASSCHLQCGEFFVNAGDTMAILCPQACTVWKANCRLSVVYV